MAFVVFFVNKIDYAPARFEIENLQNITQTPMYPNEMLHKNGANQCSGDQIEQ